MLCLDLLVNLPRVRLHSAVAQASLVKQVVGLQTVLPEARSEGDQDFCRKPPALICRAASQSGKAT